MTDFGPVLPELVEGARNAVDVCLAVKPGERVALWMVNRPEFIEAMRYVRSAQIVEPAH
jgi:acyl-CoA synthetase (AMP-forming)/AMP-acid ligase II